MTITFKVPFTTTEVALFMPSGLFFYFLRKRFEEDGKCITIIRFLGVMMALYTYEQRVDKNLVALRKREKGS